MTRFPGEKMAIQNKQATTRLPHHEYNIDCKLSNLRKHFIITVFPLLHVYSRISCAKQKFHAFLKMDYIILYNFSGGHSPIRDKRGSGWGGLVFTVH